MIDSYRLLRMWVVSGRRCAAFSLCFLSLSLVAVLTFYLDIIVSVSEFMRG